MKKVVVLCNILVAMLIHCTGQGIENDDVIHPPPGTVISARVNATNVTTLNCQFFSSSNRTQRIVVMWVLNNQNLGPTDSRFLLHGVPHMGGTFASYRDKLTILRFAPELDGQALTCLGSSIEASFPLIVFYPPGNITDITIEPGDTWVTLSWQPPSNLGGPPFSNYQVYLEAVNTSQDIKADTFTLNNTISSFIFTGLLPRTMYVMSLMTLTNLTGSIETGKPTLVNVTTQSPHDSVTIRLSVKINPPCQDTLSNNCSSLEDHISSTLLSDIEAFCNCSYRMEYIYDRHLDCTTPLRRTAHYTATLLATRQWTKHQVQSFVVDYLADDNMGCYDSYSMEISTENTDTTSALPAVSPVIVVIMVVVIAVVLLVGMTVITAILLLCIVRRRFTKKWSHLQRGDASGGQPRLEFHEYNNIEIKPAIYTNVQGPTAFAGKKEDTNSSAAVYGNLEMEHEKAKQINELPVYENSSKIQLKEEHTKTKLNDYANTDFAGKRTTETTPSTTIDYANTDFTGKGTTEATPSTTINYANTDFTGKGTTETTPSTTIEDMYENLNLAKKTPTQTPKRKRQSAGLIPREEENVTKTAVNDTHYPLPDIVERANTGKVSIKNERRLASGSLSGQAENTRPNYSQQPTVYAEVLVRGWSLRSDHNAKKSNDLMKGEDAHTNTATATASESNEGTLKDQDPENDNQLPPPLPPETVEKYITTDVCPPLSTIKAVSTRNSKSDAPAGPRDDQDEATDRTLKDCDGEHRQEENDSVNHKGKVKENINTSKAQENKGDGAGKVFEADIPVLSPETNSNYIPVGSLKPRPDHIMEQKSYEIAHSYPQTPQFFQQLQSKNQHKDSRKTGDGGSEAHQHSDHKSAQQKSLEPHPPKKGHNTAVETTENLYDECKITEDPNYAVLDTKHTISAQKLARQLHRNKTASSNKTTPPTKKIHSNSHTISSPAISPTVTPPATMLPSPPITPHKDGRNYKYTLGMSNTLRPRKKPKEDAKRKRSKISHEDEKNTSALTTKEAMSNLTSRARSMTSLLDSSEENDTKEAEKGSMLKTTLGLWKKKSMNRTESLASLAGREDDSAVKKDKVDTRQKTELPSTEKKDIHLPAVTHTSSSCIAQVPQNTNEELVYAEISTSTRIALPYKPSHTTASKLSLEDNKFPSISELENVALRQEQDTQYEIMAINPRNRKHKPQITARRQSNDMEHKAKSSNLTGKGKPHHEDQMHEVMARPSKELEVLAEEQLYEVMAGHTTQETSSHYTGGQSSAPTQDEEYEVMTTVRPAKLNPQP